MKKNFIINKDFDLYDNQLIYENINVVGQYVRITKVDDNIEFTSNYVSCPRIAYSIINGKFIFDLGRRIVDFVYENYPNDCFQVVLEEPYCEFKQSVLEDYKVKHVEFIENWSKVILHRDGSFEKIDYPLKPYSVELKDAYDLVHNLLIKYKLAIEKLLEEDRFIPTITGGLDTRCLSALYRDKNIDTFYLNDIKQDGKNRVDLGKKDLECALTVANHLGITKHTEDLNGKLTLSGMFTEGIRGMYNMDVNDERFIYKFIQHRHLNYNLLLPFSDDLFLQIKQPRKNVFRCLMCLILCPDLLQYGCIGTYTTFIKSNYQPYNFFENYKNYIKEAQDIIDYWGEEKVKNILVV